MHENTTYIRRMERTNLVYKAGLLDKLPEAEDPLIPDAPSFQGQTRAHTNKDDLMRDESGYGLRPFNQSTLRRSKRPSCRF